MRFRTAFRTLLVIIAGYGLFHVAFAQGVETDSDVITNTATLLHAIVGFLSWGWVGLAALAGKLMTNDIVFGGAFHVDIYIFKIWTMTKNIANYMLGFGFIAFIARTLRTEDVNIGSVVKQVGGFVLAGILVNMSLFFVQALVDLSTIGVTAVGSMSELFISTNSTISENIASVEGKKMSITYTAEGKVKTTPAKEDSKVDAKAIIDSILPKNSSVAGPFVYLGSSILKVQNYTLLRDGIEESEVSAILKAQNLALGSLIQLAVIGSFTLALAVLIIVNIIRVIMIWMLAALGPLLFLLRGLKRGGVKLPAALDVDSLASGKFKFSSFMQLIFIPVFTTLLLSLTLIFSTMIYGTLHSSDDIKNSADNSISYNQATDTINDVISLTYEGNFLGKGTKNSFADLIIALMTMFLVWTIVRFSIPTSNPIIGNIGEQIFKTAGSALGSVPIVHVPGQGLTSVSALKNFTSAKNPNSINPLSIGNRVNAERQNTSNNNAGKFVNKLLGTSTGTFNTDDIDQAIKAMNNKFKPADQLDTFFSKASSLAQSKDVNTFSFVGSTMFTDDVLKTLRPPISKTTGIPDTKDNATFYKNKRVIEKITEELKKNNFVPQNGIDPTDLDTLKTTAFVRKQ